MNILDYIILGVLAVCMIIGFVKGLLKQLLALVGIFVVATLTATLTPIVQSWLIKVISNESICSIVSLIATFVILTALYSLIAWLIGKALKKVKILKALDTILGGVIGIAIVYMVFAVVFALLVDTQPEFLANIKNFTKDYVEGSWIAAHVYSNNFFGDWVINGILQKVTEMLQSVAPAA